jgi:AcrR family transcriptional regulator
MTTSGYGGREMVRTPWGDATQLRQRMLPPGRGTPREVVERNQRERLFAALVATIAEKGYEAATVADLAALSGVSRSAFYQHFADKEECFLAAVETLIEPTLAQISREDDIPVGEERARRIFSAFIDLIVAQPAAARMCFVDVYAAGPRAVAVVDRTTDAFQRLGERVLRQSPEEELPPQLVRGLIGGWHKVIHKRLYQGDEEELSELAPEMWAWGRSYPPPPKALRTRRRTVKARPFEDRQALANPAERILRAFSAVVAEKGYSETTVAAIVDRAETSQRTFYEHFANKEEAMLAALDSGSAQMLAATLPAFRRAPDWPHAVRSAYEAMFAFGVEEPEYARLGTVETYGAGKRALEQRDRVMEGLETLLTAGYELAPEAPKVAAEAIGGAIYALLYDQVRTKGPESLPEMVPLATYVTLAPFVGAEQAFEIAVNSES